MAFFRFPMIYSLLMNVFVKRNTFIYVYNILLLLLSGLLLCCNSRIINCANESVKLHVKTLFFLQKSKE